jgi:secreted trypsin-like serine protease
VPYTKAEIAADALKPVKDREHLAERNEAELNHRCGGSRIAPDLVVTAAHCVAQGHYAGAGMARVLDERRVRIGTPHLGWGGTTYAIAGVAVPAGYVAGRQDDDIALLLIKPDRDTGLVEQVTLGVGSRPLTVGTRLTGYGWGYTGAVAPTKNPMFNLLEELQHNPDRLQFGEMVALGRGKCQQLLRRPVGGGMVCLVAPATAEGTQPERNVFTCRGDSGGPLVRGVGLNAELVGVTSWSLGCGYKDFPSVYTNVTKYGRWIAAARQRLKPGAAIRVDEKGAPSPREGRPQGR